MAVPPAPFTPSLEIERSLMAQGCEHVAGVDEVGRGSWAGPLVAAAVILPARDARAVGELRDVRDSKQLSPKERDELLPIILKNCLAAAVGWASHHAIDRGGLALANRRAMERAVCRLAICPDALVIDAVRLPELNLPQYACPKADGLSLSVAAASILAKVVRDRWMTGLDRRVPGYGFAENKGYGTWRHREAVRELGPCPAHRMSFAPFSLNPE